MQKNINRFLFSCILIFVSVFVKAQTDTISDQGQEELLYREARMNDPHDRLVSLKDLLKSGLITKDKYKAAIYVRMAETINELNSEKLFECTGHDSIDIECKKIVGEITALYDSAMRICEACMPNHIKSRYDIESDYYIFEKQAKKDLAYLKSIGYKEDREGFPIGISYSRSPANQYIGFEASLIGEYSPWYKLKTVDKNTGKKEVLESYIPTSVQSLTCGFNKNLQRNGYEVWASFGQVTSPIMFNPAKFGFSENYVSNEKIHWFYRPELGLGWGIFSVNCGYNLVFKKAFRREDNKWFVTVRLTYPIFSYD